MANFVFNIAKGRAVELMNRVNLNDPAAAELNIRLLASTGLEAQSVLEDVDTFTALVAGATNFATNTGSTPKELGDGTVTVTTNDTLNRTEIDVADQTWTALANDGTGAIGALVSGYDPAGTGADAGVVPITHHDFAITPDSSDVTAQITDLFRAS